MKSKQKTVEQWLKTLPEPYKSKALSYAKKEGNLNKIEGYRYYSILYGFNWLKTKEGGEFWKSVFLRLIEKRPLPPFPKSTPVKKPVKPTEKKRPSSTYLVGLYLRTHSKAYIHDLKKSCKANNVPQRISALRNVYGWNIKTVSEGVKNGVSVFHYKLIKAGKMPKQYK
jgi:hypothetical protein